MLIYFFTLFAFCFYIHSREWRSHVSQLMPAGIQLRSQLEAVRWMPCMLALGDLFDLAAHSNAVFWEEV